MKHTIVYADPKVYAGWPANHGAWQWGDEFLVGFLRGTYKRKSMHNIAEPFEKVQARSLDGGLTWNVETPDVDFECRWKPDVAPSFVPDENIFRMCGVYDHGGDDAYEGGAFYKSADRGKHWNGPWQFNGLEDRFDITNQINTSRSRVKWGMFFLTAGQANVWGTDYTFCAEYDGHKFNYLSTVLEDNARAAMPAVTSVGEYIVAVMRRRKAGRRGGWIEAVRSSDDGLTWEKLGEVGDTGSSNGNPPAIITLSNGSLLCCYGNRDHGSIVFAISDDVGETWRRGIVREGDEAFKDIGYPQLFLRQDGTPVCVYYWADRERPQQHIVATSVEA